MKPDHMEKNHQYYMQKCLGLAKIALAAGNPPVGALVVAGGEIIGTGIEAGKSTGDITNHAEIAAIRDAVKNGFADKLSTSSLFTTHEPCIMCSYVIRHHRIPEIIYGTSVPFVGGATSKFDILLTHEVPKWGEIPTIISGVCTNECNQLTEEFKKLIS